MKKIGDLFQKDIRRKIEEVIKVDQTDESVVHDELTEYIATDSLRDHLRDVLKAYGDAPTQPTEGVGVWVWVEVGVRVCVGVVVVLINCTSSV